jgi:hypothetical protein
MAWSKHAGMLRELRKASETRAEGEWFYSKVIVYFFTPTPMMNMYAKTRETTIR